MKTLELNEALARLNQDGETEIARAAQTELDAIAARIAELEAALQNSRIALTFYRQWLLDANPQTETAYPFGKKAENAARALLEAK